MGDTAPERFDKSECKEGQACDPCLSLHSALLCSQNGATLS